MIKKATGKDAAIAARLARKLWEGHTEAELTKEMENIIQNPENAVFLLLSGNTPIGFAQCSLRHDYVEGTCTSPVGYLEGIYVAPAHRRKGYAKKLLESCEWWAKQQNCTEFASDCEISNQESLDFHTKVGFAEENRIICFAKKL